jgi:signal peptidase I
MNVPASGLRRAKNVVSIWFPWLVLGAFLAVMWPVRFGGNTSFMIVSGHSMDPTYHTGDLVITKKRANYRVGEIVVYRIPGEGAGARREVVHRLHEVQPDGKLLAKGDNNRTTDPWAITAKDIVGSKWIMVPKGGVVLGFLRSILMLSLVFGFLVTWVFWPREVKEEDEPASALTPAEPTYEPHWLDDDAIIAEWDTLLAPRRVAVATRHWLDDDGVDDVGHLLRDEAAFAG